ncbi:hypothetical protein LI160_03615 [Bacteroides xylanisolvens]|uniref:hypothetical protein n=1 Tax=Bacteroides TaxID=816 RepID=UPI00129CF2B0|nr:MULTISPECIES: hypothetical protein [Bacteroides]MCB6712673.1 hypothetical protein [Bacteroides xylanisolvens]MCB6732731.1 hypothetical protein [Bacteroides xylanisolvens]MCB7119949.1 hypothetical protein [Bacteroides xylanisolvens]
MNTAHLVSFTKEAGIVQLKLRYLYLPTAVVTSFHSRDEFLPRPWEDLVTAVANYQYR